MPCLYPQTTSENHKFFYAFKGALKGALRTNDLSITSLYVLQDYMVVILSSLAGQFKGMLVDNPTQLGSYKFDRTREEIIKLCEVT